VYIQRITVGIVTVRVDEELKGRMKKYSDVNWSDVIRKAIHDRLSMEEKMRSENRALVREASLTIDRVFEDISQKYGAIKFDSSETIRTWRDLRYSYRTRQL